MAERKLSPDEAMAAIRKAFKALDRAPGVLDLDEFQEARYFVRMSLTQLDADEMSDRLHAFVAREVRRTLPGASATVSFHHARPDSPDEDGDLDLQEVWHDIEPTFRLSLTHPPLSEEAARAWVAFLPRFHAVLAATGRPSGWRPDVHEGSSE